MLTGPYVEPALSKTVRKLSSYHNFVLVSDFMKKGPAPPITVSELSSSEEEPEAWESGRRKFEFHKKQLRHNYKKKVLEQRKKELKRSRSSESSIMQ